MISNNIIEKFLNQVEVLNDHPAVIANQHSTSYSDLGALVRRIASCISSIGDDLKILIYLPQGKFAYASMLGTLMAGSYYTTTNISSPKKVQEKIFRSFDPDIVISSSEFSYDLENYTKKSIFINVEDLPSNKLRFPKQTNKIAYVIFTSGSTGEPKGVIIGNKGLEDYISWAIDAMEISPQDRWSQHPNIAFDLSVLDIYGALCGGATLFPIIDYRDRLMTAQFIDNNKLTIWNSVPSVIDLMKQTDKDNSLSLSTLRLMTFCGEPLLKEHLDFIFSINPKLVVHNTYGPTEATVSCTLLRLTKTNYINACNHNVAIGQEIPHMRIFLLDGKNNNEGEIVLSGSQLAFGYWKDKVLTENSFNEMNINGNYYRVYRTGDWAIYKGKNLFFNSRIDNQVKIHGHRLELGQVDSAIRSCGQDTVCTVMLDNKLYSFIEKKDENNKKQKLEYVILKELNNLLPSYAIPSKIIFMDQLPRNSNDKIDINALKIKIEDDLNESTKI